LLRECENCTENINTKIEIKKTLDKYGKPWDVLGRNFKRRIELTMFILVKSGSGVDLTKKLGPEFHGFTWINPAQFRKKFKILNISYEKI